MGTNGNKNLKVRQEWEQSGTKSGNKNPEEGQEWERSGNKNGNKF